jgi:hypothetical protein
MTVAAMQMADMKVWARRSSRVVGQGEPLGDLVDGAQGVATAHLVAPIELACPCRDVSYAVWGHRARNRGLRDAATE